MCEKEREWERAGKRGSVCTCMYLSKREREKIEKEQERLKRGGEK